MNAAVKKFVKHNDKHPVISGSVYPLNAAPDDVEGGIYKFEDGKSIKISSADHRELPSGYPKWKH